MFRLRSRDFLILAVLLGMGGILYQAEIVYSSTRSLPACWFVGWGQKHFARGDHVTIDGHQVQYISDPTVGFIKRVVGLPGDNVSYREGVLWINGIKQAELKRYTRRGRPLTPLPVCVIAPQKVLVLGGSNSYDSRYAEFGLVDFKDVKTKVYPLF